MHQEIRNCIEIYDAIFGEVIRSVKNKIGLLVDSFFEYFKNENEVRSKIRRVKKQNSIEFEIEWPEELIIPYIILCSKKCKKSCFQHDSFFK